MYLSLFIGIQHLFISLLNVGHWECFQFGAVINNSESCYVILNHEEKEGERASPNLSQVYICQNLVTDIFPRQISLCEQKAQVGRFRLDCNDDHCSHEMLK